jgi:hypothetical protein
MVPLFRRYRTLRATPRALAAAAAVTVLAGCSSTAPPQSGTVRPTTMNSQTSETVTPTTAVPDTTVPATAPTPAGPAVTPVTAADLGATWRPGCPVAPERLRRVELDHLGFDGHIHRGALVVDEQLVPQVIELFGHLRTIGYPIAKMRTVDHYPNADDEASMADNNTSAFNCRGIPGSTSWSYHAYGRAIDLNPLLNPYIGSDGEVQPANAGPYTDRDRTDPGILHAGDPVVLAFTERGWAWGGAWRTPKDYQHFEQP